MTSFSRSTAVAAAGVCVLLAGAFAPQRKLVSIDFHTLQTIANVSLHIKRGVAV